MHKSKLPLLTWFWAIYLVVHDKGGKPARALSDVLEINYRTALRLLRKIREAMRARDSNYPLSGLVEMDDPYFGGRKTGTDGRGTGKTKVAIALSTDEEGKPRHLRMKVIDKVSIQEIHRVAEECIAKGSTILSDGHVSYKQLSKMGYQNISKNYYKEDKDEFLKWLHTVISNAKTFVEGTYHGLGSEYLQTYLDEFCYERIIHYVKVVMRMSIIVGDHVTMKFSAINRQFINEHILKTINQSIKLEHGDTFLSFYFQKNDILIFTGNLIEVTDIVHMTYKQMVPDDFLNYFIDFKNDLPIRISRWAEQDGLEYIYKELIEALFFRRIYRIPNQNKELFWEWRSVGVKMKMDHDFTFCKLELI